MRSLFVAASILLIPSMSTLWGQDDPWANRGGAPPQGLDREAMWYAPTAEDWERPVLITFQRTWEDALAVSKETGRPILICVNMDGEIASEHYAGIRYRQQDIATLYEPYVAVIASVYRHNPRDYDEEGNRILCPRFGSVTCGEHITIEPILYEQFFDGRRIAPRHIMVELDGEETYDVFYAWDTDSVFRTIKEGMDGRASGPATLVKGDRPIVERVASRDIRDRIAVEKAYAEGDKKLREQLLQAAREHIASAPVDLLRQGVFGLDVDLGKAARDALAGANSTNATDLISEALSVPMENPERDALIGALTRIGERSPRAKTLSVVHRGLSTKSDAVDVGGWSNKLVSKEAEIVDSYEYSARIADQDRVLSSPSVQDRAGLAEAFLSRALEARFPGDGADPDEDGARLLFIDARETATNALTLASDDWRSQAVVALSAYYLGEHDEARSSAKAAVDHLPEGEASYNAMAVLELFAKLRAQQIGDALKDKKEWPPEWLTDVNAACAVLAKHPLGTDGQIAWHYDILRWLDAKGSANRVLQDGLGRFPESGVLHQRMRRSILREHGVEGLESMYDKMLASENASSTLEWFAGYASKVAAEFHRRRGHEDRALASYENSWKHFEKYRTANPEDTASADTHAALILAARARLAIDRESYEDATDNLVRSFERAPSAAATRDGLNLSPADTSRLLRARLVENEKHALVKTLDAALAKIDPKLLELPDYERDPNGPPPRREGRGRRRDRSGN